MNKRLIALAMSGLMVTGLVGCGASEGEGNDVLKVGMVQILLLLMTDHSTKELGKEYKQLRKRLVYQALICNQQERQKLIMLQR